MKVKHYEAPAADFSMISASDIINASNFDPETSRLDYISTAVDGDVDRVTW